MSNEIKTSDVRKILHFDQITGDFVKPTLLLSKRGGDIIGQIPYDNLNVSLVGVGLDEISFDVHKSVCPEYIWEKLEGLRIIDYRCNGVKFERFEATVTVNDADETIKSVTAVSLENELGQRILYDFNINNEDAFENDMENNKNVVLYDKDDVDHSLLHKILKDKAPHWSIDMKTTMVNVSGKVESVQTFQRTFTVDGTSIYDFLTGELAEEANLLFRFNTYDRIINVYNAKECVYNKNTNEVRDDLWSDSVNFYYKSNNEKYTNNDVEYLSSIGDDTSIILTKNKLGKSFTIDEDTDSVKNMLKVTGGDEKINDTVRAVTQTGTNTIIGFSELQHDDMSDDLQTTLKNYTEFLDDTKDYWEGTGGIFKKDTKSDYKIINDQVYKKDSSGNYTIWITKDYRIKSNNVYILQPYYYTTNGYTVFNEYDEQQFDYENYIIEYTEGIINSVGTITKPGDIGIYNKNVLLQGRLNWNMYSRFPDTSLINTNTAEQELNDIVQRLNQNPVMMYNSWTKDTFAIVTNQVETMMKVYCYGNFTIVIDDKFNKTEKSPTISNDSKTNKKATWTGHITVRSASDATDYVESKEVNIPVQYVEQLNIEDDNAYFKQKMQVALSNHGMAQIFNSSIASVKTYNLLFNNIREKENSVLSQKVDITINDDLSFKLHNDVELYWDSDLSVKFGEATLKKGKYEFSAYNVGSNFTIDIVAYHYTDRFKCNGVELRSYEYNGGTITIECNDDITLEFFLFVGKKRKYDVLVKPMLQNVNKKSPTGYVPRLAIDVQDILNKYNLNSLKGFADGFVDCLTILEETADSIENDEIKSDLSSSYYELYDNYKAFSEVCTSYYNARKQQCDALQEEINQFNDKINTYHELVNIQNYFQRIHGEMYGNQLYKELCSFIREDEYNNPNYISDGIENDQAALLKEAQQLVQKAREELNKSCVLQKTVSGDVNNIFAVPEQQALYESFDLFNYIRVKADDYIWKLRLVQVDFNTEDLSSINVTFSEQIEDVQGTSSDLKSLLESAASIATSYSSTVKQAGKGVKAINTFTKIKNEGLNAADYIIKNSNAEEVTISNMGVNCATMNDIGMYGDCQTRLVGNGLYITDDGWRTIKSAIGKIKYNGEWRYGLITEVIIGDLICSQQLRILNEDSSVIIDENGMKMTNGIIHLEDKDGSTVEIGGDDQVFSYKDKDGNDLIGMNKDGEAEFVGVFTGEVHASSGYLGDWKIADVTGRNLQCYETKDAVNNKNMWMPDGDEYNTWISGITDDSKEDTWALSVQKNKIGLFYVDYRGDVLANKYLDKKGVVINGTGTNLWVGADNSTSAFRVGQTCIAGGDGVTIYAIQNDVDSSGHITQSRYSAAFTYDRSVINDPQGDHYGVGMYKGNFLPFKNNSIDTNKSVSIGSTNNRFNEIYSQQFRGFLYSWNSVYEYGIGVSGDTSTSSVNLIPYTAGKADSDTPLSVGTEEHPFYAVNARNMYVYRPKYSDVGVFKIKKPVKSGASGNNDISLQINDENTRGIYFYDSSSSGHWLISVEHGKNSAIVYGSSDKRLKNYIQDTPIDESINLLKNIPIRQYTYKSDQNKTITNGVFAQDVRDYLIDNNLGFRPYLIIEDKDSDKFIYDVDADEENVQYGIDYSKFVPELWNGWQYHNNKIEKLEKENRELKDKCKSLEERLSKLEKLLGGES